jgi:hypothetical protein
MAALNVLCRPGGQACWVASAPAQCSTPTAMKVAFISPCSGEHTVGPQAVLPRSLMRLVARLYGRADAVWTTAWAGKYSTDSVQQTAPNMTTGVITTGNAVAVSVRRSIVRLLRECSQPPSVPTSATLLTSRIKVTRRGGRHLRLRPSHASLSENSMSGHSRTLLWSLTASWAATIT